jgi:FAD/FMN-containing dehydrogenase
MTTGKDAVLEEAAVEEFKSSLRGELLLAGDSGYDEARALWNAMIDRRPALIARCAGVADVIRSVNLARDHGLLVSVRGGGHNIAGKAASDGGLMIDLSPMNEVRVDPAARTARVGPGATLGDVDHETQAFGLATPLGINSTTGIAGLTLGGGFGWLSRKYGFTVDNLLAADVVTANGELVTASETDNSDLFWGIRGGGGNFGIVTSFQFQLHPIGPEVLSGLIVYRFEDAGNVLRHYRSFVAQAPDDLSCWAVLRKAPPLPFLPEEVHGTEVLIIAVLHAGDMKEGERLLRPLREYGDPIADVVMPHPYAGFQQAFDPLLTPGARNYWKSHNFSELSDGAIETILEYVGRLPTPQCEIFVAQLGGAASRIAADATAYPHRDAAFVLNVHTRWEDAAQDEECVAWAREFADATTPLATGGVYVNFISEGEERVRAAYGANYDRLVELKNRYDPTNLFRLNQNIKPTV